MVWPQVSSLGFGAGMIQSFHDDAPEENCLWPLGGTALSEPAN
jgi:hypothetical protein